MLKTARCYEIDVFNKLLWEEMVTYDDDLWGYAVGVYMSGIQYGCVHYLGKSSKVPKKPEGMTHCSNTFEKYDGTHLDLSNFDTSNVTSMIGMFYGCEYLKSLDLSTFDTSNVTDMSDMFNGCDCLQSLDVSSFDTSNVTDMSHMFFACESLKSLDLSNFDTSNVTDMSYMFRSCISLKSLDLSNFDTSKVENTEDMFAWTNLTRENTGFGTFSKKSKTPNVCNKDSIFDEIDELFHSGNVSSPTSLIKDLKNRGYSEAEIVGTIYVDIKLGKLDMNLYKPVVDSYISKVVTPSIIKVFSDRSVGEVLDILYAKYPRDLVNEAMCMYLRPQYLVD